MDLHDILGRPLPEKSGTVLMKVYKADHEDIKRMAKACGLTMTKFMSSIVARHKVLMDRDLQ